jgi:hypothetical protein
VILASLSPVQFTMSELANVFQGTSLGVFGPNETVRGWFNTAKTQLSLSIGQLLGPRLGAAESLVSFDIGWVHIDELPPGSLFDEDSWGYRVVGALTYEGVFGGATLRPRLRWTHDFEGVTPGPAGAFLEGRKTFTAALDVQYTQRWTAGVSYVRDFGGHRVNGLVVHLLEDRDAVRFNLTFHY